MERSNMWMHQSVPACGPDTKRELIYTPRINNSIYSIIRSVELKTPDCFTNGLCRFPLSFTHSDMLLLAVQWEEEACFFTLFTVGSSVAAVAHTVARHAESVSPALRIDTLGGGNVTLGALPAAVALAAPPGVLAVTAAQDRAGSWGETTGWKG